MSESLLGRVARLVGGTFTTMLDAAENAAPEVVARQAIEEIDAAIDEVRTEIGRKQANRHNANRELSSLNNRAQELTAQIKTALDQGRDDLAQSGTHELLGIEDRIPIIESLVASTQEEEQALARYLSGLRSKRDEMKKDLDMIRERNSPSLSGAPSSDPAAGQGSSPLERRVERASDAVARVKSSVTGVPEDTGNRASADRAELEELHRKHRIEERLAALKKER